jgi:hypothetical protein
VVPVERSAFEMEDNHPAADKEIGNNFAPIPVA